MLLSHFTLIFQQIQKGTPRFTAQLMTILVLIEMVFVITWEMFHRRKSSDLVLLLLLVDIVSAFKLQSMYISLIINIRSSLIHLHGFPLLLLLPLLIEITFWLQQQDKSSKSKVKFRQASYPSKRILEAAKLAYGNKTRQSMTSKKLGSLDFQ